MCVSGKLQRVGNGLRLRETKCFYELGLSAKYDKRSEESERRTKASRFCFFFTLFDREIICRIVEGKAIVFKECQQAFEELCRGLLVRLSRGQEWIINVKGEDKDCIVYDLIAPFLLGQIASFWVRMFGSGRYHVPSSSELALFRSRCYEMGVRTTFGKVMTSGYEVYLTSFANQHFIPSRSIRAAAFNEAELNLPPKVNRDFFTDQVVLSADNETDEAC